MGRVSQSRCPTTASLPPRPSFASGLLVVRTLREAFLKHIFALYFRSARIALFLWHGMLLASMFARPPILRLTSPSLRMCLFSSLIQNYFYLRFTLGGVSSISLLKYFFNYSCSYLFTHLVLPPFSPQVYKVFIISTSIVMACELCMSQKNSFTTWLLSRPSLYINTCQNRPGVMGRGICVWTSWSRVRLHGSVTFNIQCRHDYCSQCCNLLFLGSCIGFLNFHILMDIPSQSMRKADPEITMLWWKLTMCVLC